MKALDPWLFSPWIRLDWNFPASMMLKYRKWSSMFSIYFWIWISKSSLILWALSQNVLFCLEHLLFSVTANFYFSMFPTAQYSSHFPTVEKNILDKVMRFLTTLTKSVMVFKLIFKKKSLKKSMINVNCLPWRSTSCCLVMR